MKKILSMVVLLLALCLMAGGARAANTINQVDGVVEVSAIDSDWVFTETFSDVTSGMRLISIQFNPGAADDVCVVKNGSDTGPALMNVICMDAYDQRVKYFDSAIRRPYLDYSACTLSSGATVIFGFDY